MIFNNRILLIALGGIILLALLFSWFGPVKPDSNTYQAVTLSNGALYFGKLEKSGGQYVLDDAHFLKTEISQTNTKDLKLSSLGEVIYVPLATMVIDKDHVLYWMNLKKDSPVITGIQALKERALSGGVKQETPPAPAPAPEPSKPVPQKTTTKKR